MKAAFFSPGTTTTHCALFNRFSGMPLSGADITSSRTAAASSKRCPFFVAPNRVAEQNVRINKPTAFFDFMVSPLRSMNMQQRGQMKVLETRSLLEYLGPGAVGDSRDVVNRFTSPGDCRSPDRR